MWWVWIGATVPIWSELSSACALCVHVYKQQRLSGDYVRAGYHKPRISHVAKFSTCSCKLSEKAIIDFYSAPNFEKSKFILLLASACADPGGTGCPNAPPPPAPEISQKI